MTRLQRLKARVWETVHSVSPTLEHHLKRHFSRSYHENWGYRTRLVRASPDNAFIPRVQGAGRVVDGFQIMHNGLKVMAGSYYGAGPIGLLRKNRGVHEPQEERVFQEVLKVIRPGSAMLELGAYWAFYSMWFCREVPQARPFMVEPVAENLEFGRRNFAANGFEGHFTQAYVGAQSGRADDGTPVICVDDHVAKHQIGPLAMLHCDIQGFELDMLRGAGRTLGQRHVDWVFISTHSEDLHAGCEAHLRERGFVIVASISLAASYSWDGVLVARSPETLPIPAIELSRRS